jgi:hypothetical protein
MARIRTIKPDFWTDAALIECSLNARLLFIGTWNFADDYGNLDRSPKQIKARILPADNIDCEPPIRELIVHGLLVEYSVSGKIYLHIQGFTKHQLVNRPGKPSCPDFNESLIVHSQFTDYSVNIHGALRAEGKGREGSKPKTSCAAKPELNGAFSEFWSCYPKKKAKGSAERAWVKIKPNEQLSAHIIAAVERAKTSFDWRKEGGMFIPHPATWLNNKGWEDEQAPSAPRMVAS